MRDTAKQHGYSKKYYEANKAAVIARVAKNKKLRLQTPEGKVKDSLQSGRCVAKKQGYAPCSNSVEELVQTLVEECQICGAHEQDIGERLCLDHCHSTGKFRGWLCKRCNSMLSMADDDARRLQRAAEYLKKHG